MFWDRMLLRSNSHGAFRVRSNLSRGLFLVVPKGIPPRDSNHKCWGDSGLILGPSCLNSESILDGSGSILARFWDDSSSIRGGF